AAAWFLRLMVARMQLGPGGLRPERAEMRRLLVVGGKLVVRTAALLGAFTIATAIATRLGPTNLAAHQIALQVFLFIGLSLDALAVPGQAMTGTLLGRRQPLEARAVANRLMAWGGVAGALFALALAAS